jgi:hypothetical protein
MRTVPFKNRWLLLYAIVAMASTCSAETRWCSVTGKAKSDTIFYPPIGRAAHIEGTVVSRITYSPSGKVIGLETVFGPPLLATSVNNQMKSWTVQTDAQGAELCQSLLVIGFAIGERESFEQVADTPRSIYRINVRTYTLVLSDPAYTISQSHWNWLIRFRHKRKPD